MLLIDADHCGVQKHITLELQFCTTSTNKATTTNTPQIDKHKLTISNNLPTFSKLVVERRTITSQKCVSSLTPLDVLKSLDYNR